MCRPALGTLRAEPQYLALWGVIPIRHVHGSLPDSPFVGRSRPGCDHSSDGRIRKDISALLGDATGIHREGAPQAPARSPAIL